MSPFKTETQLFPYQFCVKFDAFSIFTGYVFGCNRNTTFSLSVLRQWRHNFFPIRFASNLTLSAYLLGMFLVATETQLFPYPFCVKFATKNIPSKYAESVKFDAKRIGKKSQLFPYPFCVKFTTFSLSVLRQI